MAIAENVVFKVGGRKFEIYLEDGYPTGDLPRALETSPRFQRFLARKIEEVRDIREGMDLASEDARDAESRE